MADTRTGADHLAELAGLPRERVEVAYVGAEERVFEPGWSPAEPFTVLFVGKLIPLHGVETVLAAARAAPELRFRLVGSGQLDSLVRERPANVDWIPWVEYERLPEELHRAGCALGIFGTSEKAKRVIPNKAFQALACGTPLVTADTPGARELLVDGESALLVPPGDAQALAEALRGSPPTRSWRSDSPPEAAPPTRLMRAKIVLGRRWRELIEQAVARVIRPRALLWTAVGAYAAGSQRSPSCATEPSRPAASTSGTWCSRSGRRRTATRSRSRACAATRSPGSARTSTRSSPPSRRSGSSGRARTCCS